MSNHLGLEVGLVGVRRVCVCGRIVGFGWFMISLSVQVLSGTWIHNMRL